METFTGRNDWIHIYFMQMQSFVFKKKRLIAYSMLNHGACDHDAHFKYHVVPKKKKKKRKKKKKKKKRLFLCHYHALPNLQLKHINWENLFDWREYWTNTMIQFLPKRVVYCHDNPKSFPNRIWNLAKYGNDWSNFDFGQTVGPILELCDPYVFGNLVKKRFILRRLGD